MLLALGDYDWVKTRFVSDDASTAKRTTKGNYLYDIVKSCEKTKKMRVSLSPPVRRHRQSTTPARRTRRLGFSMPVFRRSEKPPVPRKRDAAVTAGTSTAMDPARRVIHSRPLICSADSARRRPGRGTRNSEECRERVIFSGSDISAGHSFSPHEGDSSSHLTPEKVLNSRAICLKMS